MSQENQAPETTPPADNSSEPAHALRLVWGPDVGDYAFNPPPGSDAAVKPDAELTFVKVETETGDVHLDLSAHDPAHVNPPQRVYLLLYGPGASIHSTPEAALASSQPQSFVDVPAAPAGATIVLSRPETTQPGVAYRGKTVVQFAS